MKAIEPSDFVTSEKRRVLTDAGLPGRDGREGVGSTTEQQQGRIAAAIFANAGELDTRQLDEVIEWVRLYKS